MRWVERRGAGLALRLGGLALLAMCWLAGHTLRMRALAFPIVHDPLAYALAAISFLAGSVGAAMALLGPHLFDRVRIARRWSRYG